jgi:Iron-containing redox enzyme
LLTNGALEPDFGDCVALEQVAVRPEQLYRRLVLVENNANYLYPAYRFILDLLDRTLIPTALKPLGASRTTPSQVVESLLAWAISSSRSATESLSERHRRTLLVEYAPIGLLDGCWLQGATALHAAEVELGVNIQEQHKLRAAGEVTTSLFGAPYRLLFQQACGRTIECYDESFASECGIAPTSFEHALVGLALGHFPSTFMPEIVGFNLWQACVGPCPMLFPARSDAFSSTEIERLARQAVHLTLAEGAETDHERVVQGFILADEAYHRWEAAVTALIALDTPAAQMFQLLERKGRFAIGYHKNVRLSGVSIDDLFSRGEAGVRELIDLLASSRFVRAGEPEHSRLVTTSIALRGPMFEVFTAEELTVIRDWISSLGKDPVKAAAVEMPQLAGCYQPAQDAADFAAKSEQRFDGCDVAELAFYFVNADLYPIVRPYSATIAARVSSALRRVSSASVSQAACPPYSLAALDALLEDLRIRQLHGFEKDTTPPLHGQALVDAYLCGYPSICTDGSWLQGCANVANFHLESNQILFRIYREENGDGDFAKNHNYIGRQLLASMGGEFPRLTDLAFFKNQGVRASFFGPCCNFALSINTQSFMPEVLGLNLAVEANGVGWKFRKGSTELRAAGFDPLLMDLHDTIDNFASGHTSMSKRAIVSYLEAASKFGEDVVQSLWERIWHAYQGVQGLIENRDNPEVQAAVKAVARGNVEDARSFGAGLIDLVSA